MAGESPKAGRPAPLGPDHLDDTGAPCAHHTPVSSAPLLQLALVGTRAVAFHHDCASKLQGILMALEELSELTATGDAEILRAVESATEASRELNALLNTSRALTKPPMIAAIAIGELLSNAASRVAVALRGAVPDAIVGVAIPAATQALALVIDAAAGTGRSRTLEITGTLAGDDVEAALRSDSTQPGSAREALAIASFAITRDGGRLWCAATGTYIYIRLPRAPP